MKTKKDKDETPKEFDNSALEDYEEVQEKKTSKLGYILLIIMVIFIITIAQTVFDDLKNIPERPIKPERCIGELVENNKLAAIRHKDTCFFQEIDKMFELDTQYAEIEQEVNRIVEINKEIWTNNNSIQQKERTIRTLNQEYDLSLQEKMASESSILNKEQIKANITTNQSVIASLESASAALTTERQGIIKEISPNITKLSTAYKNAEEHYKNVSANYQFKVLGLMFLFVLPFFLLSAYNYLRLKRKNSPYTIIFTAVASAAALLLSQVVLMFLHEVLPIEWFEKIFEILRSVPILRYVLYYGSVILVIALFGGLVYFIQKKVFSPEKVAIRRLKENKCPSCSFKLNSEHQFCPKCGNTLKSTCAHCGGLKIKYLKHCPHCGKV